MNASLPGQSLSPSKDQAFTFIAIGDPHLGGCPRFLPPALRESAFDSVFEQALKVAQAKNTKNIVILGDVFDKMAPDPQALAQAIRILASARDKGIVLYILDGNHGFIQKGKTSLFLLKALREHHLLESGLVHIYDQDPVVTRIDGQSVAFFPWPHKDITAIPPQAGPTLIFAHCQRPGLKTGIGEQTLEGVEDFALGNDKEGHSWVIGDNHAPQRGPGFIYPGAPLTLRFGEGNERALLWGRWVQGALTTEDIPLELPYRLETLTLTPPSGATPPEGLFEYTRAALTKKLNALSAKKEGGASSTSHTPIYARVDLPFELTPCQAALGQAFPNVVFRPLPPKFFAPGFASSAMTAACAPGQDVAMDVGGSAGTTTEHGQGQESALKQSKQPLAFGFGAAWRKQELKTHLAKFGFTPEQVKKALDEAALLEKEAAAAL